MARCVKNGKLFNGIHKSSRLGVIFSTHQPWGTLELSKNTFSCHDLKELATGIEWVDAKDAAKYPTKHCTAFPSLYNKNYPRPNVSGITIKKPCYR